MSERQPEPNLPAEASPEANAPNAHDVQKANTPRVQDTQAMDGEAATHLPAGTQAEQRPPTQG